MCKGILLNAIQYPSTKHKVTVTFLNIELHSCYIYNAMRLNLSSYTSVVLVSARGKTRMGIVWEDMEERGRPGVLESLIIYPPDTEVMLHIVA